MNFIKKVALVLTFFAIHVPVFSQKSAVTYTFSGGRFGDNLIAYCHAVWIAYQYKLDLLYKPFKYSDQLMMHDLDMHYLIESATHYKQTVHINHLFHYGLQPDTLYVVPYFPESYFERNDPRCPFLFQVDWNDQSYINILKNRIASKNLLSLPSLPKDCITLAVHVRKGTGFDIPQFAPSFEKLTEMGPLKWPPDSYYIEQIGRILKIFPNRKIYIHIFTDHDKPVDLIEKYKTYIKDTRVSWGCRREQNKHDLNVLEDFFALIQFDCLIRNDSNFSMVASKIGDYTVLISPWENSKTQSGEIEINCVIIEFFGQKFQYDRQKFVLLK